MQKLWLIFFITFSSYGLDFKQAHTPHKLNPLPINFSPSLLSLGVEKLRFSNEDNLFTSLQFSLLDTNQWYYGIGGFFAVAGSRGGFNVLGGQVGYRDSYSDQWFYKAELFLGAGGGSSAPVGGGLMIRPSVLTGVETKEAFYGLGYAVVYFPDGQIANHHLIAQVEFPMSVASYSHTPSSIVSPESEWVSQRWQLGASTKFYFPIHQTDRNKNPTSSRMGLVGVELVSFLTPNLYLDLELHGMFFGGLAGYMTVAPGVGYDHPLSKNVFLRYQLNLGGAGGGNFDTAGGFFIEPTFGGAYRITPSSHILAKFGYLASFGSFQTPSATLVYAHDFHVPRSLEDKHFNIKTLTPKSVTAYQLGFSTLRYFLSGKLNQWDVPFASNIDSLGLELGVFLSRAVFLSGKTYWAYLGNAGGYAAALLGATLRQPLYNDTLWHLKTYIGAGGGGNLPAGGGLLLQGAAGIDYKISRTWGVFLDGGVTRFGKGITAPMIEIGATFQSFMPEI